MTHLASGEPKTNILKDGLLGKQEHCRPSPSAAQTPAGTGNLMLLSLSCQGNKRWGSLLQNRGYGGRSKDADHYHGHASVVRGLDPCGDLGTTSALRKRTHVSCSLRERHLLKQEEGNPKGLASQIEPGSTPQFCSLLAVQSSESFQLSRPQFPHLQNGDGNSAYFGGSP